MDDTVIRDIMDWTETNSYLKGICNRVDDSFDRTKPIRIAAFDLDDTLILRPKGKSTTWTLLDKSASKKIRDLIEQKYLIVVFTNQSGMGNNINFDKMQWRKNATSLCRELLKKIDQSCYMAIYASKTHDMYRKPNTCMWNQMQADLRIELDIADDQRLRLSAMSFYCGDAAGRTQPSLFRKRFYPTSKKDFSDTDRKFAYNLKLQFKTPEEFYKEDYVDEIPWEFSGLDPIRYLEDVASKSNENRYVFKPRKHEMILMVGPPGSGKSTFVEKYLIPQKYVVVNRDTYRTKAKCIAIANKTLLEGKSVVIDNTNYDIPSRMTYTLMAERHGYTNVRCIILNTDIQLAKHLANVRHVYSRGAVPQISSIVYSVYNKSYVEPAGADGFNLIETINFRFDPENVDSRWLRCFKKLSEA